MTKTVFQKGESEIAHAGENDCAGEEDLETVQVEFVEFGSEAEKQEVQD